MQMKTKIKTDVLIIYHKSIAQEIQDRS